MNNRPRLIERAFPLKQASLDSVHEKNVRHGHISTLHIWPARRPLAACRAALIAALLPDPSAEPKPEGMSETEWQEEVRRRREKLCQRIGGKVVKKINKKRMPDGRVFEREEEETEGGILHWKRETENATEVDWFRQAILEAYGGQAPKVLDPFAGGGAIPLEAMRLGCEVTAADINPVAWFILKCTLEYPQRLAGRTHRLPGFILRDETFMRQFFSKGKGYSAAATRKALDRLGKDLQRDEQAAMDFGAQVEEELEADLAWHVRAWGQWVLGRSRCELARFYPVYANFEPLETGSAYERQPMRIVPFRKDGIPDLDALNAELSASYLADPRNPRWVAKPAVAYLWARTVTCKHCRSIVPLLRTRWLCRKGKKRVRLTLEPNADHTAVTLDIDANVPLKGSNAAQRRENDKRLGEGTMSKAGARCPCCGTITSMEDIRVQGQSGRLGAIITALVVNGSNGKAYRKATELEARLAGDASSQLGNVFSEIPFGLPDESLPPKEALGFRVPLYGIRDWSQLFLPRQLLTLGVLIAAQRAAFATAPWRDLPRVWREAIAMYLAASLDRVADRDSTITTWENSGEFLGHTFTRFAFPMVWDFAEGQPQADSSGGYPQAIEWVGRTIDHLLRAETCSPPASVRLCSVLAPSQGQYDLIITDPPYYDAIAYADLMDFFYIWLRRVLWGLTEEVDGAFNPPLSPKWDSNESDGELIDDASRFGGDREASKRTYEEGMARAFAACYAALEDDGRLIVVFAHKHPDAWETLVSAVIRAGFVVDGSWPIQTERQARTRAMSSAALASSVWLVCKKRPEAARPGWDNRVLEGMRARISERLRDFWDAGIRGPDFVWAATGPALEAYSKHPVVKKADEPGEVMTVEEFLTQVRRMVVDFVVGRVLSGDEEGAEPAATDRMDAPTAYYLLHRHYFGHGEAPIGASILYATACGLSDRDLDTTWDLLVRPGSKDDAEDDVDLADEDASESEDQDVEVESGGKVRLKTWTRRTRKGLGYDAPGGHAVPLIDRIHRLLHLWTAGDKHAVDDYLDEHGLRRHELFSRVVQSLIELSRHDGAGDLSLLESLSKEIRGRGARPEDRAALLPFGE